MTADTYRRYARDIKTFMDALARLLEVMDPDAGALTPGSPRRWMPRPGLESEAARRRGAVDLVTGRAARAFDAAGMVVSWKPRGTWQEVPVNPATSWSTIIDFDPRFDVDVIVSCAGQAVGILEMHAEDAEEQERERRARPVRRTRYSHGTADRQRARTGSAMDDSRRRYRVHRDCRGWNHSRARLGLGQRAAVLARAWSRTLEWPEDDGDGAREPGAESNHFSAIPV